VLRETSFGSFGISLILLTAAPFFLFFRAGLHVWLFWERLRRRRLIWALTHIQVQLALALAVLGAAAMAFALVVPGERSFLELDTWVFTILPFMGAASLATLVGLAIILPPAFLFAWLAARRTTRRLDTLTEAAAALRRGQYATRVHVEGEDELAQLQADFNAMADALDDAVHRLEAERDKVAELLTARRQLVASVSHELRTPLATMRGYLEGLEQADLSETAQRDLDVIGGELTRLQALIDDLFTLSRAEVEGLALNFEPVEVAALVQRRVDAVAPLAWQRERVQLIANVPPAQAAVWADRDRLDQILVNLIRNARRHTPPGGIVAVSVEVGEDAARLRVCDTGEGIPADELPHVWERFYRGKGARTREPGGAGLGLSLVKELTEAMGGRVAVESTVGQGACFTVALPTAEGSSLASS
jgi:signal transduction histidine kinase